MKRGNPDAGSPGPPPSGLDSAPKDRMRGSRLPTSIWFFLAVSFVIPAGGCVSFDGPPGPPTGTYSERIETYARLLALEDRRAYDPLLTGYATASPDAWIRAKNALAVGRLRDPAASIHFPVLLRDPEPSVRRAAAFGAGLTTDRRLIRFLATALSDPDRETASRAAEAIAKLGGDEAVSLLLAVLDTPSGPRATAAFALFRYSEPRVIALLLKSTADQDAEVRRAVLFALARRPKTEALPALRPALDDNDPTIAAWAARAVGILADAESVPRLLRLAHGSDPSGVIEALLALEKIGAKTKLTEEVRLVALERAKGTIPGIALSALKLLGRFPGDLDVTSALSRVMADAGRRSGVALVSLMTADPANASKHFDRALETGALELRLAAAEAVFLLPPDRQVERALRMLQDRSARVRALVVSGVPKDTTLEFIDLLLRALADPDAAVRSAALESTTSLLDAERKQAELERAWREAYERAFREKDSDFTVGALDAASARKKEGRTLIEARVDDSDPVVRDKARRLLVEKFEVPAVRFASVPLPVTTRFTRADYIRIAHRANETLLVATVTTTRGAFELALDTEEAPLTAENFRALAARRFFDGVVIHRVVPDFVVQAGDPRGDGSGGPGYAIRDEINPLRYTRGALGMALSGPDTGGSQWFLTLSPQPHLDGGYTVFGRVISGDPVLDLIEQDDQILSVTVRESARAKPPAGATDR